MADTGERPSRVRSLLRNAVLMGVSASMALAVSECAVRLAAPQQLIIPRPDIWMAVDSLGWIHRANVRTSINTGERTITFATDGDGFRIGSAPRRAATKRVLLMGDSFGAALQVEHEQSLPSLLEARLPARLGGTQVAVDNAAVNGYSPSQYLIALRRRLNQRRYDLAVVLVYLGNDILDWRTDRQEPFAQTSVRHFRAMRSATWSEFVAAVLYPINDYLKQRSHLFVLAKNQTRTLLMRFGLTYLYVPEEVLRANADKPRWHVTAEVCRDIDAAARRANVPVLFVLVPSNYQIDPEAFRQYLAGFDIEPSTVDLDQPNRLLPEALAPYHLKVIDMLTPMRAAHEKGARLFGRVDVHFSPAGHDVAERTLEPTVVQILQESRAADVHAARR